MKDFLGNELNIGDEVVLIQPGYRSLMRATIIRFTKCYVILSYAISCEIKQTPDQLIKIK